MKRLIVLMMLLMMGTANARILEIEYKRTANNVYEAKSKYGRSIVYVKDCSEDTSYLDQWKKGYFQEEKIKELYYYTLMTEKATCPVMDIEELETY